jgi:hypothetical protein
MRKRLLNTSLMLAVLLLMAGFSVSQTAQNRTLIVNGQSGQVAVLQIEGRSFVDLAALAQIANGSLGFQGNRITLTLPAASAGTPSASSSPPPSSGSAFSGSFMKAGIEFMSVIREWRSAQANALQNGYPVTAAWVANYRSQAQQNLSLASVAASTDSDQQALQLLTYELQNMDKWSNKVLEARKNMDAAKYMSPDALNNDPLFQKILNCAHSLASMASSGQFEDDGSCH